jgi:uncharacterized protein YndB with AHSA1/START domain
MIENLRKTVDVDAGLDEVWQAWTTEDGLKFISSNSNVQLLPGGAYEWFLDLEPDENGKTGGQGARLLAIVPREVLVFSWTFPPAVPSLRKADAMTQVVVRFEPVNESRTRVRLDAVGWQEGDDWAAGRRYFDNAWDIVLQRLKEHFAHSAS